jgi:hypothetical protein
LFSTVSLSFFLMSFFWFFTLKYIWQNLKQCKNKNWEGSKEQSRWMKNISTFFGIVHKTGTFTTNVSLLAYYIFLTGFRLSFVGIKFNLNVFFRLWLIIKNPFTLKKPTPQRVTWNESTNISKAKAKRFFPYSIYKCSSNRLP